MQKKDRRSNRTRQKNKRVDSKVESNDSPEIPERGRHQISLVSLQGWTTKLLIIASKQQQCQGSLQLNSESHPLKKK